jgi:regulator of sigma D
VETADTWDSEAFISALKTHAAHSTETSNVSFVKVWLHKPKHIMVKYYELFSKLKT